MLEITDNNFDSLIQTDKLVVVDFYATWCGPCRNLMPIMQKISEEVEDSAIVGKVDIDNNAALVAKFGVQSIPTVIFIKDEKIVERLVGGRGKESYLALIDKHSG